MGKRIYPRIETSEPSAANGTWLPETGPKSPGEKWSGVKKKKFKNGEGSKSIEKTNQELHRRTRICKVQEGRKL